MTDIAVAVVLISVGFFLMWRSKVDFRSGKSAGRFFGKQIIYTRENDVIPFFLGVGGSFIGGLFFVILGLRFIGATSGIIP